jgi:multiple sugar transport system substrate-binding protein
MIFWSPFILDELAGLRESVPVTVDLSPPLHRRTGVVTAIAGPSGQPAQWGQVGYFGIGRDADTDAASRWVEFLLTDGYLIWLSMAPEAKFPMRSQYAEGWRELEIGSEQRAKISRLYPPEVIEAIIQHMETFDRWGFASGQGACMAHIYGTKTVIRVLNEMLSGEIKTAQEAARIMNDRVRALEGCTKP